MSRNRIFVCTDHDGHWPVPVASVVIATDVEMAADLLDVQLEAHGLQTRKRSPYTLKELTGPGATILSDGEY